MKSILSKLILLLRNNFSLDLRALALMRMGVALIVIVDLIIRSNSLIAFYTDDGVLPLSILYKSNWNPSFFSVYVMSTGWKFIALVFCVNFLIALALFLGYRTRLMSILCWLFMISLHNRNHMILQGGDELLRLTLFWGIFLPWGAKFSVDGFYSKTIKKSFFGIPVLGYLMLQFSVYFFSALLKSSPEWRSEGTALYYALNIDQLTWPLGNWLLNFPGLLKVMTHYTYFLELLVPFLLFIPFYSQWFRIVFISLIGTFHLAISMTMFVGLFYLIGMVTMIGLIPENLMDKLAERFKRIKVLACSFFSSLANVFHVPNNIFLFKKIYVLPELLIFQLKLLKKGILFFIICLNFLWCMGNVRNSPVKVNDKFHWFVYLFRFDQNWGMFAPSVFKEDGWYIYEAEQENKNWKKSTLNLIDLNRGGKPVDYNKPKTILSLYEDDRWRKFGEIWLTQPDKVKKEFCRYLRNKWNIDNPKNRITRLKIVYMKEVTLPDYLKSKPERTVACDCEKW